MMMRVRQVIDKQRCEAMTHRNTRCSYTTTARLITTTIGDGTHTRFTVAHNLGTHDTIVAVYDKDDGTEALVNLASPDRDHVIIDTGFYLGLSTYWKLGPLHIPRPRSKLYAHPGTIPARGQLKVVVIG